MSTNLIPSITEPMGAHWRQPPLSAILIDDKHAVMTASSFGMLAEYSATRPSGVYPGKMWKRHDGLFDALCRPEDRRWLLCWFGEVPGKPELCSNNHREILVVTPCPETTS